MTDDKFARKGVITILRSFVADKPPFFFGNDDILRAKAILLGLHWQSAHCAFASRRQA